MALCSDNGEVIIRFQASRGLSDEGSGLMLSEPGLTLRPEHAGVLPKRESNRYRPR
jgi:hypothetical protein